MMNNALLRMVIADDERYIRNGLSGLDWDSLGLEVRLVANGLDALVLVRNWRPDILLTDIRMPGMDGMELIELTKRIHPECKSIILTGYPDFEYAQKAIEFGAVKFILKPADNDEIMSAVSKCAQQILKEQDRRFEYVRLLEQARKDTSFDLVLSHALNGRMLSQTERSMLEDDEVRGKYFAAAAFVLDRHMDAEIFRKTMNGVWCVPRSEREYCVVFRREKGAETEKWDREQCIAGICALSERGYTAQAGIGCTVQNFASVAQSFAQAEKCANLFFSHGETDIVRYEDIAEKLNDDSGGPELIQECLSAVSMRNYQQVESCLDRIGGLFSGELFVESHYIKYAYIDICISAQQIFAEVLRTGSGRRLDIEVYDSISAADSLKQLDAVIREFILNLIDRANEESGEEDFTDKAIAIMEERYSQQFSLGDIAGEVHVNPQHLSRKIKQRTGVSYAQLLLRIRLGHACELLTGSNMSLLMVAESVGIPDFRYFGRVFKKNYGITPSQYRKRHNGSAPQSGEE